MAHVGIQDRLRVEEQLRAAGAAARLGAESLRQGGVTVIEDLSY